MHMHEDVICEALDRMHGDGGEQCVARLRQQRIDDAQQAVENREAYRAREHGRDRLGALVGDRVGRPFEGIGHRRVDQLANQQQNEGEQHPPFQIGPALGPNIGPQMRDRPEQTGVLQCGV